MYIHTLFFFFFFLWDETGLHIIIIIILCMTGLIYLHTVYSMTCNSSSRDKKRNETKVQQIKRNRFYIEKLREENNLQNPHVLGIV